MLSKMVRSIYYTPKIENRGNNCSKHKPHAHTVGKDHCQDELTNLKFTFWDKFNFLKKYLHPFADN